MFNRKKFPMLYNMERKMLFFSSLIFFSLVFFSFFFESVPFAEAVADVTAASFDVMELLDEIESVEIESVEILESDETVDSFESFGLVASFVEAVSFSETRDSSARSVSF